MTGKDLASISVKIHEEIKKDLQHKGVDEEKDLSYYIRKAVYEYYDFDEEFDFRK